MHAFFKQSKDSMLRVVTYWSTFTKEADKMLTTQYTIFFKFLISEEPQHFINQVYNYTSAH